MRGPYSIFACRAVKTVAGVHSVVGGGITMRLSRTNLTNIAAAGIVRACFLGHSACRKRGNRQGKGHGQCHHQAEKGLYHFLHDRGRSFRFLSCFGGNCRWG